MLYALVVVVVVVADLNEYTEAAMGVAARAFLGPIGGAVIVGGAIFSMISASNASILAGSRVALSMSHRRHLPRFFGRIGASSHTPFVAVLAAGASIGLFALVLPLEDLAHFANLVLLLALCFVNAALIVHRRRFPDIERPFRVPLVPLVPALGILANIYLILQIPIQGQLQPVLLAMLALLVGAVLVRRVARDAVRGSRPGGARLANRRAARFSAHRALPHPAPGLQSPHRRASDANRRHPGPAPRRRNHPAARGPGPPISCRPNSRARPIETEDDMLERLQTLEGELGVPITTEVRVGRNVARAVLEAAREDRSHLIVLGWKGFTTTARKILGEVTDDVVAPGARGHHAGPVRARAGGASAHTAAHGGERSCAQGGGLRARPDGGGRGRVDAGRDRGPTDASERKRRGTRKGGLAERAGRHAGGGLGGDADPGRAGGGRIRSWRRPANSTR